MKITIRKAKLDDVKDMQNFMFHLMTDELKNYMPTNKVTWAQSKKCQQYFINRVRKVNEFAIIAEYNGEKIGYLSGYVHKTLFYRTEPKFGVLGDMFVLEEHRNKKIGTKLINEFKKWTKSKGAKVMRVESYAANKKALKFYRRHGFEDSSTILERKI